MLGLSERKDIETARNLLQRAKIPGVGGLTEVCRGRRFGVNSVTGGRSVRTESLNL